MWETNDDAVLTRLAIEEPPAVEIRSDETSLDFLQSVYRCPSLPLHVRMRAAAQALPYEHPRMAVALQVDIRGDFAERLERAILRSRLIEHKVG
jgi:hypothetical protein